MLAASKWPPQPSHCVLGISLGGRVVCDGMHSLVLSGPGNAVSLASRLGSAAWHGLANGVRTASSLAGIRSPCIRWPFIPLLSQVAAARPVPARQGGKGGASRGQNVAEYWRSKLRCFVADYSSTDAALLGAVLVCKGGELDASFLSSIAWKVRRVESA